MDTEIERLFNPNDKNHVRWLKGLIVRGDRALEAENPFGIDSIPRGLYMDIYLKLSRKFICSAVNYEYSNIFSYKFAYHSESEYHKCRLLRDVEPFIKGAYFDYAIVRGEFIEFYHTSDDIHPSLRIRKIY